MKTIYFSLLVAGTCVLAASCSGKKTSDSDPAPMTVDVARPVVDSVVLHKKYPGYLSSNLQVDLVARVNGYLVSHPYNAGQKVRKGDVLFQIESKNYSDALRQAEAQLASSRASFEYATAHYAAVRRALESDAVSAMEVAQAKSALDEADAAVKNAEAAVEQARTTLGYCTVRAPFDGRVSSTNFDVGAYLAGEAAPVTLATIYDDSSLSVNFHIPDAGYIEMLRNKSEMLGLDLDNIPLIFGDSISGKYTCSLNYMSPEIDKSTGTLLMKAKVENPGGDLRTGMYADLLLPTGVNPAAILVRDASIGTDQRGKYIYTVNDSSRVVYTPVEVGELIGDSLRIITSGIGPDTRYVTRALLKVRDGATVKPNLVD